MKKYDFFISHSSEDSEIVENILVQLEKSGAKCWYAPRDINGGIPYSKAIVEGINESKVFLLCLSKNSAVSEQVQNEIEMAYKRVRSENNKIVLQPLFIEDFDIDDEEYDPLTYYIKRFNYITPKKDKTPSGIAKEVIANNSDIFNKTANKEITADKKIESTYFVDEKESKRLEMQSMLGLKFDKEYYKQVISKYENPIILDLGCGNGHQLFDRLKGFEKYRVVGLDRDELQVERATNDFGNDNVKFYQFDLEGMDFSSNLDKINQENGIEQYDIINICMLLKHLKKPEKLFTKLRKYLSPQGILIVREFENCICYATPDPNGYFKRIFDIFTRNTYAGESHIAREVYTMLFDASFKDIKLEKMGIPTIGYTPEEKEAVWKTEFAYLRDDLKLLTQDEPDNEQYKDDYEWYISHEEEIFDEFMRPNFVYLSGKMLYSARK